MDSEGFHCQLFSTQETTQTILKQFMIIISLLSTKEHKQKAQCAHKGGMLVFVICGFIKNFLPNALKIWYYYPDLL